MSRQSILSSLRVFFVAVVFFIAIHGLSQDHPVAGVDDSQNILPEKERARVVNDWLRWRLDNIIPELMRREGIELWLVINREYNEDPVYMTLVPEPVMYARRTSILIFHDRGKELGVERMSGSYYGMGEWYKSIWIDKKKKQFETLAEFIKKRSELHKIVKNLPSKYKQILDEKEKEFKRK